MGHCTGETKTVPGRLMRPGGSFVSNVISIQPRRPLLPPPIISPSFGSATSLCLREGHAARKSEFLEILMEKLCDHMITPPSLITSNVKHCLFVFSLVSAALSVAPGPPSLPRCFDSPPSSALSAPTHAARSIKIKWLILYELH